MTKREQIIEIVYKALFDAFSAGTKESAFSVDNSEYWSPHFEYDVAPKVTDAILAIEAEDDAIRRLAPKCTSCRWLKIGYGHCVWCIYNSVPNRDNKSCKDNYEPNLNTQQYENASSL
jgi:hypothetical protein